MRNPEFKFVDTDTATLEAALVSAYERITQISVRPGSPERLFIKWVADILIQQRSLINRTGNQNLPSRAEGEDLDALGELFYELKRPQAQPAKATEKFYISEAQETAILIPKGTRVTDSNNTHYWKTVADKYIEIGDTYAEVAVECMDSGTGGNGYAIGQLNTIVDVFDYFSRCENTTVSDDGTDASTDDEYYELMRSSLDGYSCAGARGGYYFFARKVSSEIADVVPNMPDAGEVNIYVLMEDGTLASETMKAAVLAACSAEEVRPLTDHVSVEDAQTVTYNIDFTYYIPTNSTKSATEIEADVNKAVESYKAWQCARFGRDINPDKLREYVLAAGAKRLVLTSPVFTSLRDGKDNTVPQVATIGTVTVTNGGYEDE